MHYIENIKKVIQSAKKLYFTHMGRQLNCQILYVGFLPSRANLLQLCQIYLCRPNSFWVTEPQNLDLRVDFTTASATELCYDTDPSLCVVEKTDSSSNSRDTDSHSPVAQHQAGDLFSTFRLGVSG